MSLPPHIDAQISGNVSGQVAVGSHIIQNNVDHGGIVFVAAPGETPVPRRRPLPIRLGGRVPAIIGRRTELATIIGALGPSSPVELHGAPGIGKTALLKSVIGDRQDHAPDSSAVYHSAVGEPAADTLQFLFDAFCECSAPFKPTDAQIRLALADTRGLIVVDDVSWGRDEVSKVLDAVPVATALFASPRQSLWGTGLAMAVTGLSDDDAVALLAREMGRPLGVEEAQAAKSSTAAIGREPLAVLQLASLVRTLGHELALVAGDLHGAPSPGDEVARRLAASLTDDERRVLDALEAAGGAALTARHLAALTGLPAVQASIDALVALRLAQAHSPRYSATGATAAGPEGLTAAVAGLRACGDDVGQMSELAGAVVLAMRSAVARSDWEGVLSLGRLSEPGMILGRRWGAWAEVLEAQRTAAGALGQRGAEAWALHQLGTRALCLDDPAEARILLTRALELRQALGDEAGAAATRHNLDLLGGPPPSDEPDGPGPPPSNRWRRRSAIAVGVAVIALALLLVRAGIDSTGAPAPGRLVALDTAVDFGAADVGSGGPVRSVQLVNEGHRPLRNPRFVVGGPQGDDFTVGFSTCEGVTVPGSGCRVELHFFPTSPGPRRAALAIAGDPRVLVQLSGQGTEAAVAAPRAGVGVTALDFGEALLLTPTAPQAVPIASVGRAPLLLESVAVDGDDPGDFVALDGCSAAPVPPGGACSVQVVFSPSAPGPRAGRLALGFSGTAPLSVELTGVGVAPGVGGPSPTPPARAPIAPVDLALAPAPPPPEVAPGEPDAEVLGPAVSVGAEPAILDSGEPEPEPAPEPAPAQAPAPAPAPVVVAPRSLEFGTVQIGAPPARATVTAVNAGRSALVVQGAAIEGPGDFAVEGLSCISDAPRSELAGAATGTAVELSPGGVCEITLSFTPAEPGSRFGTVVLTTSVSTETVALHGIGQLSSGTGGQSTGSGAGSTGGAGPAPGGLATSSGAIGPGP